MENLSLELLVKVIIFYNFLLFGIFGKILELYSKDLYFEIQLERKRVGIHESVFQKKKRTIAPQKPQPVQPSWLDLGNIGS